MTHRIAFLLLMIILPATACAPLRWGNADASIRQVMREDGSLAVCEILYRTGTGKRSLDFEVAKTAACDVTVKAKARGMTAIAGQKEAARVYLDVTGQVVKALGTAARMGFAP